MIAARQLLLNAVKAVQAGENPLGADTSYYRARAAVKIMPAKASWREAILPEMYPEDAGR